ncbi:SWIM zinc finger domain-containing protein [Bacillus sp. OK048]|uniref:SWIM zinc finger family protein n=1 Tax=Bacillus sp. OK048 TaxID=1882761 RepID=UPI00088DF503|nr:SWIM zinc finger family protein [Bacillus sp. OK048]SDN04369.1 SWIM zinc finger [Bacillus sp. OK048]
MESTTANERIELLSEEIKDLLHPHVADDVKLVQKGLMLYRQGLVKQVQIWNAQITAMVQDVTPCHVKLNFSLLASSQCTCPHEGLCRHQMAVFFAAYSRVGSVADWVTEWREPMKEKSDIASWGLQKAKDLIKANGVLKPDYRRWVESFEVSFDTILNSKKYSSPFIIAELFNIYNRRIKASAPVEQEWRLLYEVVGIIVSFKKLAVLTEKSQFAEDAVRRAYLSVFHNLIEDADELVFKIGVQSLPFDFDEFILHLKDDVFELLTVSSGLEQERIYLYRLLWTNLFKKKEWREQEIERIHERMKAAQEWENLNPLMVAGVHISILQQKDELALDLIGKIDDNVITPYMLHWIDLLSLTKAWKRVGPFIELFSSKLKGYLEFLRTYHSCAAFTRSALKAIRPYISENGKVDLYERTLLATLPYSYTDYELMLFERCQYDKWGDLQAFMGWSFYDLPKDRVKVVEKEKPEVLLGMLHQSALNEINQKNRSSYKTAVRHLKKLRTLYKKTKRVDDWQYFLDNLMDKTKRLRAFHEECRRSKLIED